MNIVLPGFVEGLFSTSSSIPTVPPCGDALSWLYPCVKWLFVAAAYGFREFGIRLNPLEEPWVGIKSRHTFNPICFASIKMKYKS